MPRRFLKLVPGVTVMVFPEGTATEGGLGPGGTKTEEERSPWLLVISPLSFLTSVIKWAASLC